MLGVDLDPMVISEGKKAYSQLITEKRLALVQSNFMDLERIRVKEAFNRKITMRDKFDIALLDLGFSSYQLADTSRGFSYMGPDDQKLDMRFNPEKESTTAFDIVNHCAEMELVEILKKFGEERFNQQLAAKIVSARAGRMVNTTGELKQIIRDAFP